MSIKLLLNKNWWIHLAKTLKYSLYILTHPFDGFWDLIHEKRGSLAAANVITAGLVITQILTLTFTNFQFMIVNMEYFNAFVVALSIIVPMFLWTVSNWSLTTLMDGKGKMRDIYMGTAYAFTPVLIISIIQIIISHVLTYNEGVLYYYLGSFATIWAIFLLLAAMTMIHDYSMTKTVFSSLLTIVGIAIIVFVFTLFFSLISDGIAYFISLYKEIMFRLY